MRARPAPSAARTRDLLWRGPVRATVQVRHVGAGDQQHESDRGEQDQQRSRIADHLLLQRHDAERQAAVGRVEVGCSRRSRAVMVSISACAWRDGDAGLQLPDDVVVLAVARGRRVGGERQVQQDLGVLGAAQRRQDLARQREGRRQDADDAGTAAR